MNKLDYRLHVDLAKYYRLPEVPEDHELETVPEWFCGEGTCWNPESLEIVFTMPSGAEVTRDFDFADFMRFVYNIARVNPKPELPKLEPTFMLLTQTITKENS